MSEKTIKILDFLTRDPDSDDFMLFVTPEGEHNKSTVYGFANAIVGDLDEKIEEVNEAVDRAEAAAQLAGDKIPAMTLAALQSVTDPLTTGVYIKNAGKSGMFVLDNASGVTVDGVMAVNDASGNKWVRRYEGFVDVSWFGAIGDYNETTGTDNTEAIQKAIDFLISSGGGTLYFPVGKYRVSGTVYVNPANHIPISLKGCSSMSRDNGTRYSGTSIVKDTDGDIFCINMKENGAGNIVYPEQYAGFTATGFNFRAVNGCLVNAFKMWRTRSQVDGISTNNLSYVVYQPDTDANENTNYCDHSTFRNIRISNSNLGGLYLYASDGSIVEGIYLETTQESFKNLLTVKSTRSMLVNGFNFWSRYEYENLGDSSLFHFNSCRGITIQNIHVERSWVNNIFYFTYCTGIEIFGLTTEFLFNNAFRLRYANRNISISGWVSRANVNQGGSDIFIADGSNNYPVTVNDIFLESLEQEPRELIVNNQSSKSTDELVIKNPTVPFSSTGNNPFLNKVILSSAAALSVPGIGYTVFLNDDPTGATSRIISLPELPSDRRGEIKIVNRSVLTNWAVYTGAESVDGRSSYLIPRRSIITLFPGTSAWIVDNNQYSVGGDDWHNMEGTKFIAAGDTAANRPTGTTAAGVGFQVLQTDRQEYRRIFANFNGYWYTKSIANNVPGEWYKMIDERSLPKHELSVVATLPTKSDLNGLYGSYKAGSSIIFSAIGYDFIKMTDSGTSNWLSSKWDDGTKTLL